MTAARHGGEPVLVARLELEAGDASDRRTLELAAGAGELVRLPDDPRPIHALLGTSPGSQRIELAGRRLGRRSRARRARAGLVGVGSGVVAPDVSVLEHIAAVHGSADARHRLRGAPLLADRGDDPAGVLSGGERRVLDWLVADALAPRAVVLDRPGTGLDPEALAWAHEVLDRWLDTGVAALLRVGRDDEERWLHERVDGRPRG